MSAAERSHAEVLVLSSLAEELCCLDDSASKRFASMHHRRLNSPQSKLCFAHTRTSSQHCFLIILIEVALELKQRERRAGLR